MPTSTSTEEKHIPQPSPTAASELTWLLLKAIFITIALVGVFFILTLAAAGWWITTQIKTFETAAGLSRQEIFSLVRQNWQQPPTQVEGNILFLILGLDTVKNKPDQQPLTDTILLANLKLEQNAITLLPLPRDIWHDEYKTKINALYFYGLEKYPASPEKFPTEVISQLIQLPVQHTLVVSLDDLATLIDLLGGIEVNVSEGFIDTQFPREDIDLATAKPSELYETVTFSTGLQKMDGATASKYIRSRKSEGETGNDISRGTRQEQVLKGVIDKLISVEVLSNPKLLGELSAYYQHNFAKNLPLSELIKIASTLSSFQKPPTLSTQILSTSLSQADKPTLTHPNPSFYDNQWVFVPTNPTTFAETIQQHLGRTP